MISSAKSGRNILRFFAASAVLLMLCCSFGAVLGSDSDADSSTLPDADHIYHIGSRTYYTNSSPEIIYTDSFNDTSDHSRVFLKDTTGTTWQDYKVVSSYAPSWITFTLAVYDTGRIYASGEVPSSYFTISPGAPSSGSYWILIGYAESQAHANHDKYTDATYLFVFDSVTVIKPSDSGSSGSSGSGDSGDYPVVPDGSATQYHYSVRFDGNGSSFASREVSAVSFKDSYTFKISEVYPSDPVRAGYKFIGWSFDEDGSSVIANGLVKLTVDSGSTSSAVTLYAVWEQTNPYIPVIENVWDQLIEFFSDHPEVVVFVVLVMAGGAFVVRSRTR